MPGEWKPAAPKAAPTGSATVALPDAKPVQAGKLPVKVAQAERGSATSVKVEVVASNRGKAAGASGPVVALTDTDAASGDHQVKVALDLKALQGAGWADRAGLVALPECALTTPQKAECQKQTPVASTVDPKTGVLAAQVTLPVTVGKAPMKSVLTASASQDAQATYVEAPASAPSAMVLAATSESGGAMGDYAASPLSPSNAWGAGTNVGNFTYSYPIQTPASIGGSGPKVALSYDSSSADGKTSAQNAQASWIGEGWGYEPGFIERSYRPCDKAGITGSGDQCWAGQNAVLNLSGHSGTLVRDDATGTWRLQGDDGSKIEQLTGATNEARSGEYWRLTTSDGMQYYFGRNHLPGGNNTDPATNSVAYVPVYSPKSGDHCYSSTTGTASWCREAWRWNLDYVVDTHQNLVTYTYQRDLNYYNRGGGQNGGTGTLTSYVRASEIKQIAYGQRLPEQVAANGTVNPASKVLFTTEERCKASGTVTCTTAQRVVANQANWPDSPLDQACASSGTCTKNSPTFWSPLMLKTISTQVLVGAAYTTVDSWALKHTFPDPGDGTKPSLWLSSIQRTGTNGQAAKDLPPVSFTARELANRVDGLSPAQPAFYRPRIQQITTESGGQINVIYADPECSRVSSHMPAAEDSNSMACMPVHWWLPGSSSTEPVKDWFHKYLVTAVTEQDAVTGTTLTKSTNYSYGGGAAWHRNDGEFVDPKVRTWDNFRGYQTVTATIGNGNLGEAPKTQQVTTYLRGMNGDYLANGTARNVSVSFTPYPGATPTTVTDDKWRSGSVLGSQSYDKADGAVVSASATTTANDVVTATHKQQNGMPDLVARYTSTSTTETAWAKLSNGSWRTSSSVTTYDPANANRAIQVDDKGDGTAAAPQICTTNTYASSTNPLIRTLVSEQSSITGTCGTAGNAANTVKATQTFYDGLPFGQAGAVGDVTSSRGLVSYDGNGQPQYGQPATASYDAYGRAVSTLGPDGVSATTAFEPATGAIPTKVTLTGPTGAAWSKSQTFDPGRSLPLVATDQNGRATTMKYDALGRVTGVWYPDRATDLGANLKFSYAVNGITAPSVVTSQTIAEDGSYSTKNELYDGLGRVRQTQSTIATGGAGRVVADTVYDSHGWVVKTSAPYFDGATQPNGQVFAPQDSQVPAQNWFSYDGMGRKVKDAFVSYGQQQWTSTSAYLGADRVDTVPPQGRNPVSTFTDLRGNTAQLWQYRGGSATGNPADADVTDYTYTADGKPLARTDAMGNKWTYTYDFLGRQTSSSDPDTGTSRTTYDVNSRIASTVDAKGNTLAYAYDVLGRKTGLFAGSVAPANQLAGWKYDTVPNGKGRPASSTRYIGGASGDAYTQAITGYDAMYRVLGTSVTIPAKEGALAGTYTTSNVYTPVLGSLDHTVLPAMGGLPAEEVYYLYGNTGLLIASSGNSSLVTDVQYDALGRPTRTTVGDWGTQVVSTQQYDWATGRLVNSFLDRQSGTTSLDQTAYTYNPAGQITSVKDVQNASATDLQCFTYDYLGRLTNAWTDTAGTNTKPAPSVPGIGGCNNAGGPAMTGTPAKPTVGGPAAYWQTYGYDATGNRTSLVQHNVTGVTANDITTTQTFGAPKSVNTPTSAPNTGGGTGGPHGLLSTSTKSASGTVASTYQYDALGNTTSITDTSGTTTLTWNGEDKLASVSKTDQAQGTSYLYDADGSQLIRRDPGKTTLHLGSDELTLDTATASMSDVRYYGASGGVTITRVTTATGGGKLVYQAADPHGTGSVQIDTDAAQTVTRRPTDPFGNPRGTQPPPGSWAGDKGFVGGTLETATGLTNLGAREYDPVHGRFLNPDPILAPANPQQWNGYAYSNNDPLNSSDPSGMFCDSCSMDPTSAWADMHPGCAGLTCYNNDGSVAYTITPSNGNGNAKPPSKTVVHTILETIPKKRLETFKAHLKQIMEQSPDSWNVEGSHAYNALQRYAKNAIYGPATLKDLWDASKGTLAGLLVGLVGAALCPETGVTCVVAVGALSGLASQCVTDCSDAKAMALNAAVGAATGYAGAKMNGLGGSGGKGGCSFSADTPVLLEGGESKPIGEVAIGDRVEAGDPTTGEHIGSREVTALHVNHDDDLIDLTVSTLDGQSTVLHTTAKHPFWDDTRKLWVPAGQLSVGDALETAENTRVHVRGIAVVQGAADMLNLTVDELHTYYVMAGDASVLVHNGGKPEPGQMYLWRGVTVNELADIAENRTWNSPQGVKYFSFTERGAAEYSRRAYSSFPQEGPYTMIRTTVNIADLPEGARMAYTADVIDGGVALNNEELKILGRPSIMTDMTVGATC
ncbi:polymorphic toxin-type HINT domain-containing protein [Streptomyces sp. NPDC023588]|uniref:polymorphic toxin-type HINT domain-containing protein n=1 Tax=Streptomyces sp. NPDC023588 TaxID=3154907 RepID=UPI0033E2F28F